MSYFIGLKCCKKRNSDFKRKKKWGQNISSAQEGDI